MAQSEIEIMKARQSATYTAVRTQAQIAYHKYIEPLGYQDATPSALTAALAAALHALAQCWREDATWTTEQRKKGHVSTAAELRQAAARVAGVAVELSTHHPAIAEKAPPLAPIVSVETPGVLAAAVTAVINAGNGHPNYCGARPLGPNANDDTAACIRPPHASDAQSSHVNIRGDRWPNDSAIRDTNGHVITFLDPDIPPEGDGILAAGGVPRFTAPVSGVTFIEPDIPFSAGPRLSIRDISSPVTLPVGMEWPKHKHRSVSQIETYSDCSLKYRLQRYHPDVHQVPNWAGVGGGALHAAIQWIETTLGGGSVEWANAFEIAIKSTEASSGVPRSAWRVSGRGKENYDWWRVEGADMLERYIQWSRDATTGPIYEGMIEHEFQVSIQGVQVKGFIDQVRVEPADTLANGMPAFHVIDIKTGRIPTDFFQLAVYGLAVHRETAQGTNLRAGDLLGSFWNARTGELTSIDIWKRYTVEEIAWRVSAMDAAERAGIYLPSPSTFCVACPVGHACPVNPRR